MLLLLLAVIVAVYFVVASRLARPKYPGKPLKAWAAVLAGFLVIFVADHLIGLTYAYTWVRMVPSAPTLPVVADRVLIEFDLENPPDIAGTGVKPLTAAERESDLLLAYVMTMVSAEAAMDGAGGLKGSYARLQAILSTQWGPKVIDLTAAADAKSEACQFFNSMPPEIRNQWRALAAKGLENGEKAACAAITHAAGTAAEFLYRVGSRPASPLESLLGIVETAASSLSEIPSGRLLMEHRTLVYSGGWVKRTFWETASSSFETPGPVPALRPASRQRVLPALPKAKPR